MATKNLNFATTTSSVNSTAPAPARFSKYSRFPSAAAVTVKCGEATSAAAVIRATPTPVVLTVPPAASPAAPPAAGQATAPIRQRKFPHRLHGLVKRIGSQLASIGGKTKVDGKDFLKVYLKKFDADEVEVIRKVFKELSSRSRRCLGIDKPTFLQYFPLPGLWGERLFQRFDYKALGYVDYEEFLVGLAVCCRGTRAERTQALFQIFDLNGDGVLQRSELVAMLSNLPNLDSYLKRQGEQRPPSTVPIPTTTAAANTTGQSPAVDTGVAPDPQVLGKGATFDSSCSSSSSSSAANVAVSDWPPALVIDDWMLSLSEDDDDFSTALLAAVDDPLSPVPLLSDGDYDSASEDEELDDADLANLEAEEREMFQAAALWKRHKIPLWRQRPLPVKLPVFQQVQQQQQRKQQQQVQTHEQHSTPAAPSDAEDKEAVPPVSVDVEQFVDSVLEECEFGERDALTLVEFKTWLDRNEGILGMFADCLHEETWGLHGNALFRGRQQQKTLSSLLPRSDVEFLIARRLFSTTQQNPAISLSSSPAAILNEELLSCPSCHGLLAVCPQCRRSTLSLARSEAAGGGNEYFIHCDSCASKYWSCWLCDWQLAKAAALANETSVGCEGWLYKLGKHVRQWRARYFVLVDNLLYYYGKKDDMKPRGILFLEGCFVDTKTAEGGPPGKFGFSLRNGSMPERTLFAATENERNAWVAAVKAAVKQQPFEDTYDLKEEIGHGKFSIVYRGVHKASGGEVAVKVIRKQCVNEHARELLRSEIAILRLLRHPHVIRLLEVIDSQENLHLVMERVSGGELSELLQKDKRLPETQVNRVISQLLATVAYLHQCGIIHRDIKPENILLTERSVESADVKVTDFGLSCICGVNELVRQPCGTLAYVAPEVLELKGYNHQADVWSVGVIMYFLLRGKLPFPVVRIPDEGATAFTAQTQRPLQLEGPAWENVGSSAKDLLRRLLQTNPEKRITAADALQHIWIKNPTAVIAEPTPPADFADNENAKGVLASSHSLGGCGSFEQSVMPDVSAATFTGPTLAVAAKPGIHGPLPLAEGEGTSG